MLLAIDAQEKRMQVTPICSFSWHAAILKGTLQFQKAQVCTESKKQKHLKVHKEQKENMHQANFRQDSARGGAAAFGDCGAAWRRCWRWRLQLWDLVPL